MISLFLPGVRHSAIAATAGGPPAQRGGGPAAAAALRGVHSARTTHTVALALLHIRALRVPELRLQSASW